MTVLENLEMGAFTRTTSRIPDDLERVFELFPRLQRAAQARTAGRCPAASSRCWPSAAR